MSDEFLALRIQARERRDAAIQTAREDYEQTLRDIEALRSKLCKHVPQGPRVPLAVAVQAVMPQNQEFTVSDIMSALEARYPRRVPATVASHPPTTVVVVMDLLNVHRSAVRKLQERGAT